MNNERNRTSNQEKYRNTSRKVQIPGNIRNGDDQVKEEDRKSQKEEPQKDKETLEPNFWSGNLTKSIDTWIVSLVKYSRPFLDLAQLAEIAECTDCFSEEG